MTTDHLQFTIFNTLRISLHYLVRHHRDFMALMALPVIIPTVLITASLTAAAYQLEWGASFLYYLFILANFITYIMFCVAVHHHVSLQKRGSISELLAWNRHKTSYLYALGIYLALNLGVLVMSVPLLQATGGGVALLGVVLLLLVVNVIFSLMLPASAINDTVQITTPLELGKAFFGKILGVHIAFSGLVIGLGVLFMSLMAGIISNFVDIPAPTGDHINEGIFHTLGQIQLLGSVTTSDGGLAGFPFLIISLVQSVFSHVVLAFYLIMLSMFYIRATDSYNETG